MYADDTSLLTESIEDLQTLMDAVNSVGREWEIKINVGKTMIVDS